MHRNRRIAVGAAVVGSLSLGVIGVSPALADSGRYAGLASGPLGVASAAAPLANMVSNTFAGWVFVKKGSTSVSSVFTMPAMKCTKAQSGVSPGSFMLSGTTAKLQFNGAGVLIECSSGQPGAAATAIVDFNQKFDTTHLLFIGDQIKSTVSASATKTTATVSDLTHKFTFTNSGPGSPALQEMIMDDSVVVGSSTGGKQLPVTNFTKIPYTLGTVGGKALGTVTPRAAYDMKTKATTPVLQIQTGPLTGATLNAFTTTFKHA